MPQPKFALLQSVRWTPISVIDFGVIVGLHYLPAPSSSDWGWCYLIWLNAHSPSRAWICADVAWEEDLELYYPGPEPEAVLEVNA
jgi:hypothetical protein